MHRSRYEAMTIHEVAADLWPQRLIGLDLRYVLADVLDRTSGRVWTVRDLVETIENMGFVIGSEESELTGTSASKTVSGALRTEIDRGRARRVGWGRYTAGSMPESTRRRIRARVQVRQQRRHLLGSGPCSQHPSGTSGSHRS